MNKIDSLYKKIDDVLAEVHKVVIGQEYLINRLLIGLFTDGHILLEGVPGLAKTKTINTLAKVLDLGFRRVQFTPDLLPSDLVGTMIYNQKSGDFEVKKGPIFANLILADEVNRAPAKVQSALLEAMAEKQITIGEESFQLDPPFLVMATQNPVEQEGTYPLPEAQVDRFMMKVYVDYLDKKSELEMIRKIANMDFKENVKSVLGKNDIHHDFRYAGTLHCRAGFCHEKSRRLWSERRSEIYSVRCFAKGWNSDSQSRKSPSFL
jgi:MoxR-like ATPase